MASTAYVITGPASVTDLNTDSALVLVDPAGQKTLTELPPGVDGQVLTIAAGTPTWGSAGGGLEVTSVFRLGFVLSWPGGDVTFTDIETNALGAFSLGTPDTFTIPEDGLYELGAAWYATTSDGLLTNVHAGRFTTPRYLANEGAVFQIPGTIGTQNQHAGSYTWIESLTATTTFKVNFFVNGFGNNLTFTWLKVWVKKLA